VNGSECRINLAGPQSLNHGPPRRIGQDLYQLPMTVSWPSVLASFAAFFLSFNLAFAALYRLHRQSQSAARFAVLLFFGETRPIQPRVYSNFRHEICFATPQLLCQRNKRLPKWPEDRLIVPFKALLLAQ
jgi:hypothetical protein